jgi:hypothetical protein
VAVVALAGCAGPLLTGGLSAALGDVMRGRGSDDEATLARAHAVDAGSYNVAGLAGPLVVAAGAASLGAGAAGLVLLAGALLASAAIARLPLRASRGTGERALARGRQGVAALWRERPLRSTTIASTVGALGAGALPLTIVERGRELGSASTGPLLLGALAAGALTGSLLAARIRVPAERHVWLALAGLGAGLAGAALAPATGLAAAALFGGGVADGVLISAVFAVRTRHADEGMRSTVFTTAASLKIAAASLGAAAGGLIVAAAGAAAALLVTAAVQLVAALLVPVTARYPAAAGPGSPAGRIPSRPT